MGEWEVRLTQGTRNSPEGVGTPPPPASSALHPTPTTQPPLPILLYLILLASLILSALFALRVPFDLARGNPDEIAHLEYVRLILAEGGFIRFKPGDLLYSETHQPPLHYLASIPAFALTVGTPFSLFAVRMVSAVWQLLTIWVAFRAGRDLFPSRPEMALGAAAFVAFLPTQAQLAGAVNNDGLTTLLCAVLFWKMGLLVKEGVGADLKGAAFMGLFLGLGLWTKLTVIQMIPVLFIAFLVAWRIGKITFMEAARGFVVVMAVGCLVASPWLIRNTMLYGDPLTIKIFPLTAPKDTPTPQSMMRNVPQLFSSMADYLRIVAIRSYATFWYLLPPTALLPKNAPTGDIPYYLTLLLGMGGIIGALLPPSRGGVANGERRVLYLAIATVLIIVPFFIRFILQFFQAQGRYFLPGLLPVALICCLGWATFGGAKHRGLMAGGLGILLLLLSLYQVALYG